MMCVCVAMIVLVPGHCLFSYLLHRDIHAVMNWIKTNSGHCYLIVHILTAYRLGVLGIFRKEVTIKHNKL